MQRPKARIFSPFAFLNLTQFLGALNDNIFKLVIVFLLIGVLGKAESNTILAISGITFVMPFLLFSIPAGALADRFSKQKITVWTKVLEVGIMIAGVFAFGAESVWGSYTVLFFMATQSAIFGPSKYAVVPELVHQKQISRANGILVALTVFAMILGTFLGSLLTDITDRNFVLIALFCVGIAVLGLIASLCIGKTPTGARTTRPSLRIITQVIRILARSRNENYLFESLLGSSYFYLVGAYTQLNIITYALQSLGLTAVAGGYLFLIMSTGIAAGSMFAGRLSGRQVELGLTPIAAFGVAIFAFLLLVFDQHLWAVIVCLVLIGFMGGVFLVPFDAYIQAASPIEERGENVSCGSFLSFVGVGIASGLIALLGNALGLTAAQGFACIGALTFLVAAWLTYRMSDTLVRLYSRIHYPKPLDIGEEQTLYFCPGGDFLRMLTAQQRYMRFCVEHSNFLLRLCKATIFGEDHDKRMRRWIKRGYSITNIPSEQPEAMEKYLQSLSYEFNLPLERID